LIVISLVLAACAGNSEAKNNKVTIGYFPNLTHVATIIALENDYFAESFGEDVEIETKTVNNGGLFMEAMATGSIDVGDRKSTRLNSSHVSISYAVFCLKKKNRIRL